MQPCHGLMPRAQASTMRNLRWRGPRSLQSLSLAAVVAFVIPALVVAPSRVQAAGPLCAPAPPGQMGQLAGVSLGGPAYTQSQAEVDAAMQGVVCTGSRWIRFDVRWSLVQGFSPSVSDWSVPDRLVASAQAHGLSVVGIVDTTPGWAQAADAIQPLTQWGVPALPSDFGNFASAAASRYRGIISAWEIWNEPNNPNTFLVGSPSIPSNGAEYGQLVNAAAPAIAAADPGATVIVGAIAAPGPPPTSVAAPDAFLREMYAVLTPAAHQAFAAVSYHPYTWNSQAMDSSNPGNGFVLTPALYQAMVDNGDGAKQIWGTEISWVIATGQWPFTAQQQADSLTAGYAAWHAWAYTGPLLWYTWWDAPDPGYGLIDSTGLPRPALTSLTAVSALSSLPAPGAVIGTVTTGTGATPVAGATIADSGGTATTTTSSNGTYTLAGLTVGVHNVTAAAPGYLATSKLTTAITGVTTTLNFSLAPALGGITGVVTNAANGAAMPGVAVTDSVAGSATTSVLGAFTLQALSPGSHTLTAAASGFTSQSLTAMVSGGQTTTLNFALNAKPPPPVTPQLVQSVGRTETVASRTIATALPVTGAGHLLVLSASINSGSAQILSVTDLGGNTWTRIGAFATSGRASDGEMWYAAGANPTTGVTINLASPALATLEVQEFSGASTASPLDVSKGSSKSSTSPNSGSATPIGATDLVVGFVAGHGTAQAISLTAPGYTGQAQQTSNGGGANIASLRTGYRVLTAGGSQAFSGQVTSAMYWAAGFATFKAAPAPSTGSITGTVTSALGGAAIPGATIVDLLSGASTTSNGSGVYALTGLLPGIHIVTASAPGQIPEALTVGITGGQTTLQVNFRL
jgi:hypothetical protein